MINKNPIFIKACSHFNYKPCGIGQFFIYHIGSQTCSSFNTCRELFDGPFNKDVEYVGFYCLGLNIEKLNEFFEEAEKNLGIKEKDKTILFGTNYGNQAAVLKVSPFWSKSRTYRGILTMLLRAGCVYYKGNFNQCLLDYNLTKGIIDGLTHFLAGNTKFTFKKLGGGVFSHFSKLNGKDLNEQLVNPRASKLKEEKIDDIWS